MKRFKYAALIVGIVLPLAAVGIATHGYGYGYADAWCVSHSYGCE
jgi:hypothetical protein